MTTCSRPACADPVAGLIRLHRADRLAELLRLDHASGRHDEFELCEGHLARVRAPAGWELVDRRATVAVAPSPPASDLPLPRENGTPEAADPTRPVWLPSRDADVEEIVELRTARSRLLRRAFRGDSVDEGQVEGQLGLPF